MEQVFRGGGPALPGGSQTQLGPRPREDGVTGGLRVDSDKRRLCPGGIRVSQRDDQTND